jgi:preprotein translocase subunit SecA
MKIIRNIVNLVQKNIGKDFKFNRIVNNIKEENFSLIHLTNEELSLRIDNLRNFSKISNEKIYTKDFIIKWFAIVQEISFREINLKHFDNQLLAGLYLSEGKIVEMKTGEGKTLVSTLPVSLNALEGKGVHVITVNEYLAERDEKLLGKVYQKLGLTTGLVKNSYNLKKKKKSYYSDITYVSNSEVVFDYLKNNSVFEKSEVFQRPLNFCLIDEIDSILIDESRVPLIISEDDESEENLLETIVALSSAKTLINNLEKDVDFFLEEKNKKILLTENGNQKIKNFFKVKDFYTLNTPRISETINLLKAKYFFKRNRDYLLINKKICLIDPFTGRLTPGKKWSEGLQEAIETKENLPISSKSKTKLSITYPNFFMLYPKCSGMTGTATTSAKEFKEIYKLTVKEIEPRKKIIRKDLTDLLYITEKAKWNGAIKIIKNRFVKGQPILIGTSSVEKSEVLSELLQLENIFHTVLNARPENVGRENEIIALAGERFSITIATNMAGRGTDILLGGNPNFKTKKRILELLSFFNLKTPIISNLVFLLLEENYSSNTYSYLNDIQNLPYSLDNCEKELKIFYKVLYEKAVNFCNKENKLVKKLGGLFVLGTERNETTRLDNQLRGRSGRQGDPGISQLIISLEDDIIRLFANKESFSRYINDMDGPIQSSFLQKCINVAQKKVENFNYELRKDLKKYDDVINTKRQFFFNLRNTILTRGFSLKFFLHTVSIYYMRNEIKKRISITKNKNTEKIEKLDNYLLLEKKIISLERKVDLNKKLKNISTKPFSYSLLWKIWWALIEMDYSKNNYLLLKNSENNKKLVQNVLKKIDDIWQNDITRMENFKETIQLKSYTGTYVGIDSISEFRLMNYITYYETYDSILEVIYNSNLDPFDFMKNLLNTIKASKDEIPFYS